MSDARTEILDRIRGALADRPAVPQVVLPGGRAAEAGGRAAMAARFVARVSDYRATVTTVEGSDPDVVRFAVAAALRRHGATSAALADDFPAAWRPAGVEVDWLEVAPAAASAPDPRALAAVDAVVTTCATAIAETGTIILDGGPGQGPRALTLLPDLHVCVVSIDQIVSGVAAAIGALRAAATTTRRPLTLISGPSATSDIELDRVEGVHGPRRLEVVVVGAGADA